MMLQAILCPQRRLVVSDLCRPGYVSGKGVQVRAGW